MKGHTNDETPRKLSRGDVEVLCILLAVGDGGCPRARLAERLGLSPALAEAVAEGMEPLVSGGLLVTTEDGRFVRTEAGRAHLAEAVG